jgi:hypothetical protein
MFDRASKKLGMEQALFQKGAFADSSDSKANDLSKMAPQEIENLLKYGAYAFLDPDGNDDEDDNKDTGIKIEEILKSRGKSSGRKDKKEDKKKKSGEYSLQRTTFNIQDSAAGSGKASTDKKKEKLKVSDPDFWEKVMPFEGYNPKQLNRRFRSKKNEICKDKDSQSKFLKDVTKCVKDLLEKKAVGMSCMNNDEEIFDLLKRITKTKQFENKYKDKASVLLDKMLHFNDYQIIQDKAACAKKEEEGGTNSQPGLLG